MMSRKDALGSYRRAFKRAYREAGGDFPAHPLMMEMGRRGDRLQIVFSRHFSDPFDTPNEVQDAMTSLDLEYLANDADNNLEDF